MKFKNIAWNLCGLGVPLIIAVLTIPSLIKMIGLERFGLLSLAWGMIGLAGLFDLGIGRATTQMVARFRGLNKLAQIPVVVKTATVISCCAGLVGSVILCLVVLADLQTAIKYSEGLNYEVTMAAYLLAVAIPIQSVSSMFRGVNEAFENFREISVVRMGLGAATFLGPFIVAFFSTNLIPLVSTLLCSRIIALFCFSKYAKRCVSKEMIGERVGVPVQVSPVIAKQLLLSGGWVTVSNVIYTLMMQADRIIIGVVISASAISSYTIPYEMVTQSFILVGAITTVFFPNLIIIINDKSDNVMNVFFRWLLLVIIIMALASVLIATCIPYILPMWLDSSVSKSTVLVGQILCISLVPYSVGSMYLALIHAYKRFDITAKAHLYEAPLFVILMYYMIVYYGLEGAAFTWVFRVIVDTLILVVWFSYNKNLLQDLNLRDKPAVQAMFSG